MAYITNITDEGTAFKLTIGVSGSNGYRTILKSQCKIKIDPTVNPTYVWIFDNSTSDNVSGTNGETQHYQIVNSHLTPPYANTQALFDFLDAALVAGSGGSIDADVHAIQEAVTDVNDHSVFKDDGNMSVMKMADSSSVFRDSEGTDNIYNTTHRTEQDVKTLVDLESDDTDNSSVFKTEDNVSVFKSPDGSVGLYSRLVDGSANSVFVDNGTPVSVFKDDSGHSVFFNSANTKSVFKRADDVSAFTDEDGITSIYDKSVAILQTLSDSTSSSSVFTNDTNESVFKKPADSESVFIGGTNTVFQSDDGTIFAEESMNKLNLILGRNVNTNLIPESFTNSSLALLLTDIQTYLTLNPAKALVSQSTFMDGVAYSALCVFSAF